MAYFSNGGEGMEYAKKWCDRCLHREGCPIWFAHLDRNYEECNKRDSILHLLIPRSEDGLSNKRCTMFVDRGLLSNLALQQYETDMATPDD